MMSATHCGHAPKDSTFGRRETCFGRRETILVGSRPRGDAREDSDYDLVVALDDGAPDELLSAQRRYDGRRASPFRLTLSLAERAC
jgi:predicted nucleotidyltransferase